jgi:subtilisin
MSTALTRFILLPTRGFTAVEPFSGRATLEFLASLTPAHSAAIAVRRGPRAQMQVLDSIHETGAKLVALSPERLPDLRRSHPGTRIVPEVFYPTARAPRPAIKKAATTRRARAGGRVATIEVVLRSDGAPLPDVEVIAFTDFADGRGAVGRTNRHGQAKLRLPASMHTLERLYLYPLHSAWPQLIKGFRLTARRVALPPIDPAFRDARAACYPQRTAADGQGVTVGVIDTGVGPHAALAIDGGVNTVYGEDPHDFSDPNGHGTHVAGLIAGNAREWRGMAPRVRLRAYRVFGTDQDEASNFAIAKAIDRAAADGCDLLNLSLGGGPSDLLTDEAIKDARARGVLCIVAAGNEGGPVGWPGRHALSLAVSALGVRARWPRGATQAEELARPYGRKIGGEACFVPRFSNRGPQIDFTGPGLGIVSTLPGDRYGVMDGTSMACPVVSGAIARRLAANPDVLAMTAAAARADEMERIARAAALDLLLPANLQGDGMPR